jgi:predicted permease
MRADPLDVRLATVLFRAALRFRGIARDGALHRQMRQTFRALCLRRRAEGTPASVLALSVGEALDVVRHGPAGGSPPPRREPSATRPAGSHGGLLSAVASDLAFAARALIRRPGFTAAVLGTLTVGVGAATALFAVVDNTLIRPLPFPESERIVELWSWELGGADGIPGIGPELRSAWLDSGLFDAIELFEGMQGTLVTGADPEQIGVTRLTPGLLQMLGAQPLVGRALVAADADRGSTPVLLLSEGLWRRRFGADPDIVGTTVQIDETSYEVIGVMPRSFAFPDRRSAMAWAPLPSEAAGYPLGRLAERLTIEAAQQRADELAPEFAAAGLAPEGWGIKLFGLRDSMLFDVGRRVERTLWILFGAVFLLLLIAAVNVTSLVFSQLATRQGELQVRAALGAGPARIARQLVFESMLLGVFGAALGTLLAAAGVRLAASVAPDRLGFLTAQPIAVDARVLGFAALVSLLATGIIAGLPVALAAVRRRDTPASDRGATAARGQRRLRGALVVAEIAIAAVLLVGAGLLFRSMTAMLAVDPGYRTDVTVTRVDPSPQRYADERAYRSLLDQLQAVAETLPGVTAAAVTNGAPPVYGSLTSANRAEALGQPPAAGVYRGERASDASQVEFVNVVNAGPEYFQVLGMPLLAGRTFSRADADADVAIISEEFAERFWHGRPAVGGQLRMRANAPVLTVIGVVPDVLQTGLDDEPGELEIYYPVEQTRPGHPRLYLVLRGEVDRGALRATLRDRLREIDPQLPVSSIATLEDSLWHDLVAQRFNLLLITAFAAVALLLAAVGIYGVLAYSVAQRQREIGVRMALGARQADVVGRVVGSGMALASLGLAFGGAGAWGLTRFMRSLLYEVEPFDLLTVTAAGLTLAAVALAACAAPAIRATRVDPIRALRAE